ncbi:transposase [Roseibacillus persicicus]|uniref:transposase n=1 Tax=Roseibacillus persicicus TaxID=454148 RepID=UPI001679CAAF|nr:transposase [Roseibacillus persicicus]MDQ8192707.1 hypothetical protein [Roseibacillus persicicus]
MSEEIHRRKRLCHESPFTFASGSLREVYFLTICTKERGPNQLAKPEVWKVILESIEDRNRRELWNCSVFVAMPDHVHLLASFDGPEKMGFVITQWKRWIAHNTDVRWQRDFFDHRLRSFESAAGKARYIYLNPVRGGLVNGAEKWPYFWKRDGLPMRDR